MTRKSQASVADSTDGAGTPTVTVEFLKSYRPAEPPDDVVAADPCWKYEPGAAARLPYAEARRAVALEIARVVLEGETP
jgi:hypothetical protein